MAADTGYYYNPASFCSAVYLFTYLLKTPKQSNIFLKTLKYTVLAEAQPKLNSMQFNRKITNFVVHLMANTATPRYAKFCPNPLS